MAAFLEIMNDNYLRFIIFGLSAVLQTITTDCPTALVWHYFGENKSPTSLLASPLDYLPRFVFIQITQYSIRNYGICNNIIHYSSRYQIVNYFYFSCAPSGLPMPMKQSNRSVRHHIKQYERMILMRSNSAEGKLSLYIMGHGCTCRNTF